MKRIISLGLVIVSFLITNSCKVHNVEPVYQIENENEKVSLDYINIERPVVYMDDVYFIDLGKTGEVVFLNEKEVLFTGDFVVSSASKKGRLKSGTVPENGLAYTKKEGSDKTFSFRLKNGTEVTGGSKYEYSTSDPIEGIRDTKVAYKTSWEIILSINKSEDIRKDATTYGASADLKLTQTSEEVFEVVNGRQVAGTKKTTHKINGNITYTFSIALNGTKEIQILPPRKLATIALPGTPIMITPEIELGLQLKGKISADIRCDVFKGSYAWTSNYQHDGTDWVEINSTSQRDAKFFDNLNGKFGFSVGGNINFQIGPYIKFAAHINNIELLDNLEISAAKFWATGFFYNNISAKLSHEGSCAAGDITSNLGVDILFGYSAGVLNRGTEENALVKKEFVIDKLSYQWPPFASLGLDCNYTPFESYTLSSLEEFRTLLKTKEFLKFPVHDGNTIANFDGTYDLKPAFLAVSTYSNDPDTQKPIGNAVITIKNTVEEKVIEILQITKGDNILLDQQKNTRTNAPNLAYWHLTGAGNKFTLLAVTAGENEKYTNYIAISANVESGGFKDLHYAFYRKSNDPRSKNPFPVGFIRVFKDEDGDSPRR